MNLPRRDLSIKYNQMHHQVKGLTTVFKFSLIFLIPAIVIILGFFMLEWRKYCEFDFPDISQEQVFECRPGTSSVYEARIFLEGEISDTIQVLIYKHKDLKHTGIRGTTFVESLQLTGKLDSTITLGWHSGRKLFGVIQPSSNATGHLKVGCYFRTEFM